MRAKMLGTACAVLLLAACGNSDVAGMKNAIKSRLVDPDSAKFGAIAFWPDESKACIEYNAKNRMGGYSGGKVALMKKQNGSWEVDQMDWRSDLCSNTGKYIAGPN